MAAERGATNVRVFGSLLHGAADEDSDIDIVWDVVQNELPTLKREIRALLQRLRDRSGPTREGR